ncbi:fatty acid desaturase-domain-containing protein [Amylocystis lapponica]|nr:fatty acid desaturase-domain-containing protein [Amylocystis lapponica]
MNDKTAALAQPTTYSEDALPEFSPMPWTLNEIRAAIPARMFVRKTWKGCLYLARDLLVVAINWELALRIDPLLQSAPAVARLTPVGAELARWACWLVYWWFQGLAFTGIWILGHECGHSAFSENKYISHTIGYILHNLLLTPYFSWKISHHRHHSNHASMEKDEVYVPKTRTELGIPKEEEAEFEYEDYFGDTAIYTLFMLVRQQIFAFPAYLLYNVSGQKKYPKWTSHFDPNSVLFNKSQRNAVLISNFGIASMVMILKFACDKWGAAEVIKYYAIPWILNNHWFVMITYLHHTELDLPHYREGVWNFQRGAAATVDRDFLGWMGRFYLHDVAHYHVIHHFFPMLPFYNGEEATKYLQEFIGDHYHSSTTNVFRALWTSYNSCQFVEDEGDIVFYRDKKGQAKLRPAEPYRRKPTPAASST